MTISQLNKLPFLLHGFGTKQLGEKDLKEKREFKPFYFLFLHQVHSSRVFCVESKPSKRLEGDALVTNRPYLLLIIQTADCLPVFFVDKNQKVIAAVHTGWRGSSQRIIPKVIQAMRNHYGTHPSSLLAALGPCIGTRCYPVGEEVRSKFKSKKFFYPASQKANNREHGYYFDLRGANREQLIKCGLKENNVFSLHVCNHCHPRMYSYRSQKNESGRLLNFIGLL